MTELVKIEEIIGEAVHEFRSRDVLWALPDLRKERIAHYAAKIAALQSSAEMVMVPREPTEEMRRAFHSTANCVLDEAGFAVPIWDKQYTAMIAASPLATSTMEERNV